MGRGGWQTKRNAPVVVFGALSLVLSLAEQRKNKNNKKITFGITSGDPQGEPLAKL